MKKKLFFLLVLLISVACYAQKELSKDYTYTVSNPYDVVNGEKFYFSRDNQILTVKIKKDDVVIQKFNSAGEKISYIGEKEYNDFPRNFQVEDVLEFSGRYYFFYSSWDGGDVDKEQLFLREIDFAKGEFSDAARLLFKVDGHIKSGPLSTFMMGSSHYASGSGDKFDFLMSSNKKRMLIQYRKKPTVKSDVKSWDVIGMVAYDENMEQTSLNEVKMPYTERRMNVYDYAIDAEGTNYILAKVFHDDSNDDKKRKSDEEANYHVELFRLQNNTGELNISKIDIADKFINGLWLFENPASKEMVIAGYYNIGKKQINTDGMIVMHAKKEGDLYGLATYEIPVEVLNEYTSEKTKKRNNKNEEKGEAEYPNLKLKEVVFDDNGGMLLIAEQSFVVVYVNRTAGGGMNGMGGLGTTYTSTTYHYNDIIVSKLNPDGKMLWMKKIPKRQIGDNGRGGMSYKYIYNKGYHYLLFLDNVKNYELPLNKRPAEHRDGAGGYFTSYKIDDATGTSVNSSIFNVRDLDEMTVYQFSTNRIVKIDDDTFGVEFYKRKKEDVMIKVTIK